MREDLTDLRNRPDSDALLQLEQESIVDSQRNTPNGGVDQVLV